MKQGVLRLLKQADELWWHWVLKHKFPVEDEWMDLCVVNFSDSSLTSFFFYLVFLYHALYLVVDFASVMGHSEVWHLAELVPADVDIITELLLQTNLKRLGI